MLTLGLLAGFGTPLSVRAEESDTTQDTENGGSTENPDGEEGVAGGEQEEEVTDGEQEEAREIVVVLDPGHGGTDPGACRTINGINYYERDLALKIANYCKEELERVGGYKVYMTRTDNTSTLWNREERAEFARAQRADALVSFHLNATNADITTAVSGALVYAPNSNYNSTLGAAGSVLSKSILDQLVGLGLTDNGVVIRNASEDKYPDGSVADYLGINYWSKLKGFPGVLIEHAFINNVSDVTNYLTTEEQLKSLGVADAQGIINYFNSDAAFFNNPIVQDEKGADGVWHLNSTGWWFEYTTGGYPVSCWEKIGGEWYWFDSRGYMVTGWVLSNGTWYYMQSSGAMATGWQYVNGTWYYLAESGAMTTGWQLVDDNWFYMRESGAMVTGWVWSNGVWYYQQSNGAMATGWQYINGTWYYLAESGAMTTGWQLVDNNWFYMYSSGAMAANTWIGSYYVNNSGAWVQ